MAVFVSVYLSELTIVCSTLNAAGVKVQAQLVPYHPQKNSA